MSTPRTFCDACQLAAAVDLDAVVPGTVGGTATRTWRQYAEQVHAGAAGPSALGVSRGDGEIQTRYADLPGAGVLEPEAALAPAPASAKH